MGWLWWVRLSFIDQPTPSGPTTKLAETDFREGPIRFQATLVPERQKARFGSLWATSLNPKFALGCAEPVGRGVKIVRKVKALQRADGDPSGYRMEMSTRCTRDTKGGIPIHADGIQPLV